MSLKGQERSMKKHQLSFCLIYPKIKQINKAFENYLNPYNTEINSFNIYDGDENEPFKLSKEEGRKFALENLNKILKFAEFK